MSEFPVEPPVIPPIPRRGVVESDGQYDINTFVARQVTYDEQTVAENNNTPFEVALYQTNELTNSNGRIPEKVVADHMIASFREHGRDIRVIYGLNVVNGIDSQGAGTTCGSTNPDGIDLFRQFMESGDAPVVAADSNLLLMDVNGGGCAGVGGNVGVAGARNITEDRGIVISGIDSWSGNVNAAMHEIGHNMGFTHCGTQNWPPHAGTAYVSGDEWVATPTVACNDMQNACGEYIPFRPDGTERRCVLDYHDCAFDQMMIAPKPLIGDDQFLTSNFSWTPQVPAVGQRILFDGSRSTTPTGSIVNYVWTFPDKIVSGRQAEYVFSEEGTFDISLTVENDSGDIDITTRQVEVVTNPPPVFASSAALVFVAAGLAVTSLQRRRKR